MKRKNTIEKKHERGIFKFLAMLKILLFFFQEYKEVLDLGQKHVLVDVRMPVEMEICQLPAEVYSILMSKSLKFAKNTQGLEMFDMLTQGCLFLVHFI